MVYSLWFRRYAPFESFGLGFEGDGRATPSTSMSETARTVAGCGFGPGVVTSAIGESDGTEYVGGGDWLRRKLGRHFSKVVASVAVSTRAQDEVRFTVTSAGSNPMAPGAPDIDTFVDLHAVFRPRSLSLEGVVRGDPFPNAEVFVYDGAGNSQLLYHFETEGGRNAGPFTDLWGAHARTRLGSFNARIPLDDNGAFVGCAAL